MRFDARGPAGTRSKLLRATGRRAAGKWLINVGYVHADAELPGFDIRATREVARSLASQAMFLPVPTSIFRRHWRAGRSMWPSAASSSELVCPEGDSGGYNWRPDGLPSQRRRACNRNLWLYRKDRRAFAMRWMVALAVRRCLMLVGPQSHKLRAQ